MIELPEANLLEEAVALEDALERAAFSFGPSPFLGVSAPGLLMWRDRYVYAYARRGEAAFLLSVQTGEVYAPRPPAPFTKDSLASLFDYLAAANGPGPGKSRVEGLTEEEARTAEGWGYSPRLVATDFIYERETIGALHGDAYRDRRNEINQLVKHHAVLLRPFRLSDLGDCGKLYEKWRDARAKHLEPIGAKMLEQAQKAHLRCLTYFEDWGLGAWVLLVDGKLAAYTVAGNLSGNTLGIWLEVTDLTVKGAGAYIFAQTCRLHPGTYWVNTGDAEFLPGLREAKEHWHPAKKLKQFALDPKNDN